MDLNFEDESGPSSLVLNVTPSPRQASYIKSVASSEVMTRDVSSSAKDGVV